MIPISLLGKNVVVTGSTRGLGLHLAHFLAEAGARVGINGRDAQAVAAVTREHAGFFDAFGDASHPEAMQSLADRLTSQGTRLDALVCNAGGGRPKGDRWDLAEWRRVHTLNLETSLVPMGAFSDLLGDARGAVCVIGSIAGVRPSGAPAAYAASKAALHSLVLSAARDLAERGVRVNGIVPGNLMFPGSTWETKLAETPELVQEMLARSVPLHRFGTPEDIANWCIFLISEYSAFATGGLFVVDGGQSA